MKENRMKSMLESIAIRAMPDDVNLLPNILERFERRSFMKTLYARPVLMILFVLLALAVLSGVAYAIGKVTGYIPGIGLVSQDIPLRVLAEPVTVERGGITLTVEQVVLSTDKTVLVYRVEGIPLDAYDENGEGESVNSSGVSIEGTPGEIYINTASPSMCFSDERLLLPDGTTVPIQSGEGNGWTSGFENRFVFAPIPADINKAAFRISCIPGTVLGKLPEDWEISLRFVPAPPNMTVLPVIDIATPVVDSSVPAMTVEQVIENDKGYIVIGKFQSGSLPLNAKAQGVSKWITVTDVFGRIVEARPPESLDLISNIYGEFYWAYEIAGKKHAFPLTFTLEVVSADIPDATIDFEFDTGSEPKVGQIWEPNIELEIAGYPINVVSIKRLEKGYSFVFKSVPDVIGVSAEINNVPFSSSSGGNDGFGNGELFYIIEYSDDVPSGKMKIRLNWLRADIHGPWQVQWSPESILPTP